MNNAVLGPIPERLLFTMLKTDFLGSLDTKLYNFRHYNLGSFVKFVNGKQFPNQGLSLGMDHEELPSWDTVRSLMNLAYFTRTQVFR